MRRLSITLALICLLVLTTPVLTLAQPGYTPHEDPSLARAAPDLTALLIYYGNTFSAAALGKYVDAQSLLTELAQAQIPDELTVLAGRFSALASALFGKMDRADRLLDEATELAATNQLPAARAKLDAAAADIQDARSLLSDIDSAARSMKSALGTFAAPVLRQIESPYTRLEQSLLRLSNLLDASYYPTRLDASVPEKTHPGFPIPIIGQLNSPGDDVERTLKVFLDDTLLTEKQIKGRFNFEVVPPLDTMPGDHTIVLSVSPLDRYSGATREFTTVFSTLPVDADILTPSLVVLPWQTRVSGKVTSDRAPVPDAQIEVRLGWSTTLIRTAADGAFSASVNTPFNLSLAGPQEMSVTVTPTQPWYEPLQIKREVFTINPANILLILLAVGSLGLLLYRRGRSAILTAAAQSVVARPATPQPLPITPAPIPKHEFIGFKGIILSSYFSAVEEIGNLTGVVLSETMTLREFLKVTTPKIATSARPFTKLTALAELALYSTRQLNAETASRAEKQASAIREELRRATS